LGLFGPNLAQIFTDIDPQKQSGNPSFARPLWNQEDDVDER
jgi:hypothetical protein